MKVLLLALGFVHVACAQPSAVLDDLEHRIATALEAIPRARNRLAVEQQRAAIRRRLNGSLGHGLAEESGGVTAPLYVPEGVDGQAPAVLVVSPHQDPGRREAAVFAASLARRGSFVLIGRTP